MICTLVSVWILWKIMKRLQRLEDLMNPFRNIRKASILVLIVTRELMKAASSAEIKVCWRRVLLSAIDHYAYQMLNGSESGAGL
ncbi:hypothetical protein M514_04159 [Trichuris suis]|uniref:Uncharacterized protein n=1 Tax=Trichuris suis TaxID=68888 RepID=A0A085MCN1_9BILA|nr:hypothetical protein M513_04159 [Trichuris suis]KFD61608.1 hypothetical protein M514_04159 [Trichuris suis]